MSSCGVSTVHFVNMPLSLWCSAPGGGRSVPMQLNFLLGLAVFVHLSIGKVNCHFVFATYGLLMRKYTTLYHDINVTEKHDTMLPIRLKTTTHYGELLRYSEP